MGADTHARIQTIRTGSILRNQARAWFKNHKTINAGSTKEQTKLKSIDLQTNKITIEDGFLQTKNVKLKSTTSQTETEPSNEHIKRYVIFTH